MASAGPVLHAFDGSVADIVETAAVQGAGGLRRLLDYRLLSAADMTITVGGVIAAVFVVALAWLASMLLRHAIGRYGDSHEHANKAALYTVSRLLHYVLLVIGLLLALSMVGLPVDKFAVFAGAIGVGLGFGLQAIFNNFISGVVLLFDRSLKVGDFVELESGVHGEVRDIMIRATRISTNDNIDILVPNSEFVSGRVVNWTHREVSRRMRVGFGVAYGTDKELVKKAALEAAAEVPFTLDLEGPRKPQVWLVGFGDSSLDFELVVWLNAEATKRPDAVDAAYLWALHSALERYAIEIPFPQRDLHLRSLFGRHDAAGEALWRAAHDLPEPPGDAGPGVKDAELDPHEKRALARNDAQREVQQQTADGDAAALARSPNGNRTD